MHLLILLFLLLVMSSRKYASGYQKCQRKQSIDELIQSQKGAIERFIRKEPQVSPSS